MTSTQRNLWYALAAIPAGYLPLVYFLGIGCYLTSLIAGIDHHLHGRCVWWWILWIGIYATFIQWPFYLLWVLVSKELSVKLRIVWIVIIVVGNMLTMPWFLWCKYRRRTREALLGIFKPSVRQCLDDDYTHAMADTPSQNSESLIARWLPLGWKLRYSIIVGVYPGLIAMAAALYGYGWCFFYCQDWIWKTFAIIAVPTLFKRRTTGCGVHLAAVLTQYCLASVLIGSIAVSLWYGGNAIRVLQKRSVCHRLNPLIAKVETFHQKNGRYPGSIEELHFTTDMPLTVFTNMDVDTEVDWWSPDYHGSIVYMSTNHFVCVVPVRWISYRTYSQVHRMYTWSSDKPAWRYEERILNVDFIGL